MLPQNRAVNDQWLKLPKINVLTTTTLRVLIERQNLAMKMLEPLYTNFVQKQQDFKHHNF